MHFIRPTWLVHGGEKKDFEVYSCHVSPDGKRLVTAAGDCHVRIWSTDAIYNAADPRYKGPRQLASMSHHTGTIHVVRFSPDGRYLASGADDKFVCIYQLDETTKAAPTFGSNDPAPTENWRIFRRLVGHDNDVQDLAWSPDSSLLVSVGLDSKVVVWSGHTFEKLKTLSKHSSHVKGVTFDPANKYFTTCSDDRTAIIWRSTPPGPNATSHDQANNFVFERTISTPFNGSPLTTYFRRCSWAPDGLHVGYANAVNGPVSTVSVTSRSTWDGDVHLVGHEGPVEVCAFSPRLYSRKDASDSENSKVAHITIIACAGQDRTLTVWMTNNPRPILIAQDLATKSISDLAWSPDGRTLFATSLDGMINCIAFGEGELGVIAPLEENEKAIAKFGGNKKATGMLETPAALLLEEKSKEGELKSVAGRMGALMGESPTVTVNGELPSLNGKSDVEMVEASAVVNGAGAIQIESSSKDTAEQASLDRLKSRVQITKDGKKRIAPLLVSGSGSGLSSLPKAQLMASSNTATAGVEAPKTVLDLSRPFDGLPKGGISTLLFGNKNRYQVEDEDQDGEQNRKLAHASRNDATPVLTNGVNGLSLAKSRVLPHGQDAAPEFLRPAIVNPALSVSQTRLAVPKIRASLSISLPAKDGSKTMSNGTSTDQNSSSVIFEAKNPTGPSLTGRAEDREPARVALFSKGQPLWHDFVSNPIILLSGTLSFWAAACEDGSIYVWSMSGRRITNAIVLESQPVILESHGKWLFCITATGMCRVWDVSNLSSPHPPVSMAPILDIATQFQYERPAKAPAVTSARVNSEGRFVVSLANGDGYTYNPNLYDWQRISEPWWAVGSQYWNTVDHSSSSLTSRPKQEQNQRMLVSSGIIPHLERQTTTEMLVRGRAYHLQRLIKALLPREGYENLESSVSIGHLENRVAAALSLGAKQEFQAYLYMYVRRLGAEGLRMKVAELLRLIAGDLEKNFGAGSRDAVDLEGEESLVEEGSDRTFGNPTGTICGWDRKDLLKDAVLLLGKYREMQKITVQYAKLLDISLEPLADSQRMEL